MSVGVLTFGCRLNAYESEVIRREAAAAGVADAIVVNTCAVTAEAVQRAARTWLDRRRSVTGYLVPSLKPQESHS